LLFENVNASFGFCRLFLFLSKELSRDRQTNEQTDRQGLCCGLLGRAYNNVFAILSNCAGVRSQLQQQTGKPVTESPVTSFHRDKENIVVTSSSVPSSSYRGNLRSSSSSIFGCVELLAETSCSSRPPHLPALSPPYLVTQVDQSLTSHYRHVTSSPTAAMFMTSPPDASPTLVSAINRKRSLLYFRCNITTNSITIHESNCIH